MKNNFYVYCHKTLDGKMFYVGKGTGRRAYSKSHRSKKWYEFTKDNEYIVDIISAGLDNKTAIDIENKIIRENVDLINTYSLRENKPTIDQISQFFQYSDRSSTGLIWKDLPSKFCTFKQNASAGTIKYCNGEPNGTQVILNKSAYTVTHIIWYLCTGELVTINEVIDHIDGNPLNNKIENLRKVPRDLNARNSIKNKNNTTGTTGVARKVHRGILSFVAMVQINGKKVTKDFSTNKFGYEKALQLAVEWRAEQIRLLNAQGAGYTERHGT